ncbi:MAG TPA: GNAT family N-acetyltransferase [Candidatus Acidoferrales bacterium]|nr:GNAT family N-acetyltransferase [Candidatus Acidoferrales bacterium]
MKLRKQTKRARPNPPVDEIRDGILVHPCHGIEEFEACVRVERAVWKSSDTDVVPIPLFVVASETGGQVLGAFHGADLVGFTLALAGWRARRPFLHSHMTAVLEGYRDRGVGRRLKLYQREDALARGIALVEWTFDPLVTKNAYFNFMRLGAIARRYLPNAYGITTSPLHGSLPTDRLVAEWHLRSNRVRSALAGKQNSALASRRAARIAIPANLEAMRSSEPVPARQIQAGVRAQFLKWFGKGYVATGVQSNEGGMDYILQLGSSI